MIRKSVFAALAAAALAPVAIGQSDNETPSNPNNAETVEIKPITIGDQARTIDISDWIKGEKVAKFDKGKVYVIEFWATWCPPCRDSIPHLTELQQKYRDYGVTIIGVSDESPSKVETFLNSNHKDGKPWSEKVHYRLTTDPDKSVYNDYFVAAEQRGIPTAFIIGKDQRVEWIGHPMGIDKPLEEVVHDKWDRAAFKTKWEADLAAQREARKADAELKTAIQNKDWTLVTSLLDAQIARNEEAFAPRFRKFMVLLVDMDQPSKAYAYGEELAEFAWDKPQYLNQLAWTVVDSPAVKTRNLDYALKLAKRANELTDEVDAGILDTLARVYYEKGDVRTAIRLQKQAIENAPEAMAESLKETLKKYEGESTGR